MYIYIMVNHNHHYHVIFIYNVYVYSVYDTLNHFALSFSTPNMMM